MNINKKYVFYVFFVIFSIAPVLMSVICTNPPKINFELDLKYCSELANCKLTMNRWGTFSSYDQNGNALEHIEVVEIKEAYTSPQDVNYITGIYDDCFPYPDYSIKCSYAELWRHHYGVYPTANQLAGISLTDAIDWFRDKYYHFCALGGGPTYPFVDGLLRTKEASLIVFDYPSPVAYMPDKLPFTGHITFPDGHVCEVEAMGWPEKPANGQMVTVKVRPIKPCVGCN